MLCDRRMACLRMASILPVSSGAHLVGRHDCSGSYPPTPPCTLSLVIKHREKSRFHNDAHCFVCDSVPVRAVHLGTFLGFKQIVQ